LGKLILTRGVPASGKTTWALEWLAADPTNRARVNRDEIRNTNFGKYWGVDEFAVSKIQDAALVSLMKLGRDIVMDNTHLKARNVKDTMRLAAKHGYGVEFKDFPIGFAQALLRDEERRNRGERGVGMDVIHSFFTRYISKDGISLPPVPVIEDATTKFKPYSHTPGLPWAILVDIDGTLAHMQGRSPYDPTLYHTDTVDEVVRDLLRVHWGDTIIVFSARDDTYQEVTEDWLSEHAIPYHDIYLRPAGDTRNDAIVKDEMFEQHIAGKYNVRFVLDDRDRVVQMWRAKGLKALQVADGNF